ncbi:Major Facilitator Superfamily protein [Nocardioides dokdonensis FR1436]|uniref:Major Facilitator Superfamily protein n=1 Tax=Nocardioides dokdonensis FR1436 TaxID=1300347 RepID=A0A1A9GPP1_9ACTN|nr:Major Facilitator Superfamily protein [Nocardioides dokdonensis FR1436]
MVAFGVVSLFADMVYEGMRSVAGPLLGSLGASAAVVGLVTGAGEALALVLRLAAGPWADRTGGHWRATFVGYALTAVCVPLLAVTPFVGAAGLGLASTLMLLERTGKAVRSPSKSALLAGVAQQVGRGRGFAVHKALDQVGALLGPLVVAALVATTDLTWPAFLALALPGALAMVLLVQLRRRAPAGPPAAGPGPDVATVAVSTARLPRSFYLMATGVSASTFALMTFGVISFHLVEAGLLSLVTVPLLYAAAMAVEAVAALGTGWAYDHVGARVLLLLPPAAAVVAPLSLSTTLGTAVAGVLVWGAATGVQDSTVKAWVADLVPRERLGTGYGVFAAFQGAAALAGGTVAGVLYAEHLVALVALVAGLQVGALALLWRALHPRR